jgi:hypothetical protein
MGVAVLWERPNSLLSLLFSPSHCLLAAGGLMSALVTVLEHPDQV